MNSPKKSTEILDRRFMRAALALAQRGLGRVNPNPAVGCVIVSSSGRVLGRGWTQPGGRPHAETEALSRAGYDVSGATVYVTLEPCSHTGETSACADALVSAGVKRIVSAMEDPDPRVSGRGHTRLREAGLEVVTDVCKEEASELNAGFILHRTQGRPLVTLKTATTLDGRIATRGGESRWITGLAARRRTHLMRMSHDGVVVGIRTALIDNPDLTCRLPGLEEYSPVRIVLDTRMQLPLTSKLVRSAMEVPTWIVVSHGIGKERYSEYQDWGVVIIPVEVGDDNYPIPLSFLKALAERGLTRLLIEGGSYVASSLIRAKFIDRLEWFRSSSIMGGDGISAIAPYGIDTLQQMTSLELVSIKKIDEDRLETYKVKNSD